MLDYPETDSGDLVALYCRPIVKVSILTAMKININLKKEHLEKLAAYMSKTNTDEKCVFVWKLTKASPAPKLCCPLFAGSFGHCALCKSQYFTVCLLKFGTHHGDKILLYCLPFTPLLSSD